MKHPDPSLVLSENIATIDSTPPTAGPLNINAGALKVAKIGIERGSLELVLNAIDAGNSLKLNSVSMITQGFNPLHPSGSDAKNKCVVVFSNTIVPEGKMETAMNYGTTKGTKEGHGNQSDGNHFGVGLKEAAISFGGTPAMFNITQTATKGQYVMTGSIVTEKIGECNQFVKGSENNVVSMASFSALIVDRPGEAIPQVTILHPTSTEQLAKRLLYHSGLDFCEEGSCFDECDMALQSDKLIAKNMANLEETIAHTFLYTMQNYRDEQISRFMDKPNLLLTERYNDNNTLTDSEIAAKKTELFLREFSSITICCMLGIDESFIKRCSWKQSGMGEDFDHKISAHEVVLRGSKVSLSTLIASKINFDYYREEKGLECRDVYITLNGDDVRESNPYTQISRITKAIKNAPGPAAMRNALPIAATDPITKKTYNFGTLYLAPSDDWNGTTKDIMAKKQNHGTPSIEHLEDDQAKLTWPGYSTAATRPPPPGIVFQMDGIVYNPYDAVNFFDKPSTIFNIENIDNAIAEYGKAIAIEDTRSGGHLQADKIFKAVYQLARMNMTDQETKTRLTPEEAERKLSSRMFRNHMKPDGHPKPYFQDAPCTKYSLRMIELMTCTPAHLETLRLDGFPDAGPVAAKFFVQCLYGLNVSGIFDVNPDMVQQDIQKNTISLKPSSTFCTDCIIRETRLHMMAYSMNYGLSQAQLLRMYHIHQNVDLTPPRKFPKRTEESETSIVPVADQRTANIAPGATLQPIVVYNKEHLAVWDTMDLQDWLESESAKTKPSDGINKTVDKMSTCDGWKVLWVSSNRAQGMVKYFGHPKLTRFVKSCGIRTNSEVLKLDKWLQDGCMLNPGAFPKDLINLLVNKPPDCTKDRVMSALGIANTVRPPPEVPAQRRVRQRTDTGEQGAGGAMEVDSGATAVRNHPSEKINDQFLRAWRAEHSSLEQTPNPPFIFKESHASMSKQYIMVGVKYSKMYSALADDHEMKKALKDTLGVFMRTTSTVEGTRLLDKAKERVAKFDDAERPSSEAGPSNAGLEVVPGVPMEDLD